MGRISFDSSDWSFLVLLVVTGATATAVGLFIACSTPREPAEEIVHIPDRFVEITLDQDSGRSLSAASGPDAGEGARAKGEEGKAGTKVAMAKSAMDKQIAESAGILGDLNTMEADNNLFGTGGIGFGASSFVGGVIGSQYGNQYDSAGLGSRGRGRGASGYGSGGSYFGRKSSGTPGMSTGDPIILGALDRSVIDRVIKQHLSQIRYCYQKELNKNPGLYGKIAIKFVIARDGSVSSARVNSTSMDDPAVESCICQRFERFVFPQPGGGGIVIATYPLVFASDLVEGSRPDPTAVQPPAPAPAPPAQGAARSFLERYASLEELQPRDPDGYWTNTYVPGDPAIRLLEARLRSYDRGGLQPFSDGTLELDDLARQTTQPFDPPGNAALAVYLHATERNVDERTRLVVQVGLQGTPRRSGRRRGMNVAVLLDLRGEISAETNACVRGLLESLDDQRDITDRFSVVVAGKPGGVIVGPDEFRHGPLAIAVQQLFGDAGPADGPTLDLLEAHEAAIGAIGDESETPLGSNLVLLVTDQSLAGQVIPLEQRAHDSAVGGIPLSVVGIGGDVRLSELDRLTLSGQGSRRLMAEAAEADELVERELAAASRVVARAVRLRIRLAPGVELIDVMGSTRLDELRAEQVSEAERSIDQRVARDLGIQADRGKDEEGIQIVIPGFQAGDSHVVLLDVVTPGPGPVADVTVRYKDLVHLRNGVARGNLNLQQGDDGAGPLERNVLKNLLAWELSQTLERASGQLDRGAPAQAAAAVRSHLDLLQSFRTDVSGFTTDRGVLDDIQMLDQYARLLESDAVRNTNERQHLACSLRFAGLLKVQPRP